MVTCSCLPAVGSHADSLMYCLVMGQRQSFATRSQAGGLKSRDRSWTRIPAPA